MTRGVDGSAAVRLGRLAISAAIGCGALLSAAGGCGRPSDRVQPPSPAPPETADAAITVPAGNDATPSDEGIERRVEGKPVSLALRLSPGTGRVGETMDVCVSLEIAPGWEIRTLDAQPRQVATQLELELPEGVAALGDWEAPPPERSFAPDGHAAYHDRAVFQRRLAVTTGATRGEQTLRCRASFQACNERQCVLPPPVEVTIPVVIE